MAAVCKIPPDDRISTSPSAVVIAASGMAESGRILHHLANHVGDHRNLVLLVGFQAEHTLGRRLEEQRSVVNIFGEVTKYSAMIINPDKTGAVELANPETFLEWTHEQPWMVLHELAHGYHHRFLGHDHIGICECFEKAKAAKDRQEVEAIQRELALERAVQRDARRRPRMRFADDGGDEFEKPGGVGMLRGVHAGRGRAINR